MGVNDIVSMIFDHPIISLAARYLRTLETHHETLGSLTLGSLVAS